MSIRTKLLAAFVAFTVAPMALLGSLIFARASEQLQAVLIARLENSADAKKDKIETFFKERRGDITSAASFDVVRRNLRVLSASSRNREDSAYLKAAQEVDSQIRSFREGYGYLDVMLADQEGRVVYASNESHVAHEVGGQLQATGAFEEGRKGVYFTDVFQSPEGESRFEMLATAPVRDTRGAFLGEVVIEIDLEPVYAFLKDASGLGRTGEALIVRREGETALFLSPLSRLPGATLKETARFAAARGVPAQMAAQGRSGSGRTVDYAGSDVLAAWRYLPSLRWGLVTKIAAAEALSPVRRLRNLSLAIACLVLLLGVLAALLLARSFSQPITALQKGAEIIGAGDLDYRVGTTSRDEIGQLSRAFDGMTAEVARFNKALQSKAEELETANQELEGFSYSVSHDLRAPLRHISGFMGMLKKRSWEKMDETNRRYITTILESSRKMGMLIDDLLAFSRIGRSEMRMGKVSFDRLVREALAEVREETAGRDVVWRIGELPEAHGDPALLRLVLVNLIGNALKFTRTRSQAVIEIACTRENEELVFSVKDNGVGFDMRYVEKLFGVFQRLHRQEEFEGTGIGLANVRRIIARHGGRTWAESTVGEGATFSFTLPALPEGGTHD